MWLFIMILSHSFIVYNCDVYVLKPLPLALRTYKSTKAFISFYIWSYSPYFPSSLEYFEIASSVLINWVVSSILSNQPFLHIPYKVYSYGSNIALSVLPMMIIYEPLGVFLVLSIYFIKVLMFRKFLKIYNF